MQKESGVIMKICFTCGKPLTGSQRKFCSKRCRVQTYAPNFGTPAYRPKSHRDEDTCLQCGKSLTGKQTHYCSKDCKLKANNGFYPTQRLRIERRKSDLIARLGGKCSHCGYTKNSASLSFHHREDKVLPLSRGRLGSNAIEIIEDEIVKCDLLCMNCHLELHNPTLSMATIHEYLAQISSAEAIGEQEKVGCCAVCGMELKSRKARFCSPKCKNAVYQSYARQQQRGIKRKLELVERLGGKCAVCGYEKNLAALTFHHIESDEKEYQLDLRSLGNRSAESILSEFEKCQLLCANCHTELHHPQHALSAGL
jgi:predicted nucleic acid-binding Zn ribbon protein